MKWIFIIGIIMNWDKHENIQMNYLKTFSGTLTVLYSSSDLFWIAWANHCAEGVACNSVPHNNKLIGFV